MARDPEASGSPDGSRRRRIAEDAGATPGTREIPTVLIADDNADMRDICAAGLRYQGYRVLTARDGAEALRMVREERPAVVLMDLRMPGIDGYTATEFLKSHPETSAIPIVALTIHDRIADLRRAAAAGFDAYLVKPYSNTGLLEVVAYFCGHVPEGPALREARGRIGIRSGDPVGHPG
jgi:two-component system, cell cycle response regulator DivK